MTAASLIIALARMGTASDVRQLYGDDIPPNNGFILVA
jgi:hypothetical protein